MALMFFDGVYSHAVLKQPAEGDFRVQQEWVARRASDSRGRDARRGAARGGSRGRITLCTRGWRRTPGRIPGDGTGAHRAFLFFSSAVPRRDGSPMPSRGARGRCGAAIRERVECPVVIGTRRNHGRPAQARRSLDATQWYEVKKGDTLSKIAEQFYGDQSSIRRSSRPIAMC